VSKLDIAACEMMRLGWKVLLDEALAPAVVRRPEWGSIPISCACKEGLMPGMKRSSADVKALDKAVMPMKGAAPFSGRWKKRH
jgi:hypothetical protein